jgi:hypothetical protein
VCEEGLIVAVVNNDNGTAQYKWFYPPPYRPDDVLDLYV